MNGNIIFQNPLVVDTVARLIGRLYIAAITISASLTTIAILIGAFHIMIGGGDPARRELGKKWILYSIAAFTIILLASSIGPLIADLIWGGGSGATSSAPPAGRAFFERRTPDTLIPTPPKSSGLPIDNPVPFDDFRGRR